LFFRKKKKKISGVSVPGFLLLQYPNQVRKEEKLVKGGGGCIYTGLLLDKELISQHGTDKVVIKEVLQENVFSNEENREFFLQEVSLMWFISFYLFFLLNLLLLYS